MNAAQSARVAILYPGDRAARDCSRADDSRFKGVFEAFARAGVDAEPAIYSDDFNDEVRRQLQAVRVVLVWHNPIEGGRDRRVLDAMLRDVAADGVIVSAHPDTIMKLGTKDVLVSTRDLPFGSDVCRVDSLAELEASLPRRLASGARVLKQRRGHSGIGVWRVERRETGKYALRHTQRGCHEELLDFGDVLTRLAPYFADDGYLIDQAWQPRMVEGMTRAYLVRDRVVGFGHQRVVALHPADGDGAAVQPGPRLYSDAADPRFQHLRQRLENEWIGRLRERLDLAQEALPLLWDADFFLGEQREGEAERHVLCEVNVSSVSPFPDSAIEPLVTATRELLVPDAVLPRSAMPGARRQQ
jgi:hypothetical protein